MVKAIQANYLNAIGLVGLGLWSYEASGKDLHTLTVPVMGILLSAFHKSLKQGNKNAHLICMIVTGIFFFILFLPLRNSILGGNSLAIIRVALMLLICGFSFIIFVYEFIKTKKESYGE